jgi:hypothetical protein
MLVASGLSTLGKEKTGLTNFFVKTHVIATLQIAGFTCCKFKYKYLRPK